MSEKVRCIIVEDQEAPRAFLEKELQRFGELKLIGAYPSAEAAIEQIIRDNPQLIFLDVELPMKSGFDFLEDLKRLDLHPCIIFTTAYDQYAIQAIKNAAFDYLLKPIDPEELTLALNRYLSQTSNYSMEEKIDKLLEHINPNHKIRFNTRQGFILVSPTEIIYCEADWNYTRIFLTGERIETISINIGKVLDLLPADQFIRISRSHAINPRFLVKVNRKTRIITLKSGEEFYELKGTAKGLRELKTNR
jgi:two-component system, LytTR family, response regulator